MPRPVGLTGRMGLGTFFPPCVFWEQTEVSNPQFRHMPFGSSSSANRETSVSWSMVTTVQTNVHLCFPYPLPWHPRTCLVQAVGPHSRAACVPRGTECLTAALHHRITSVALAVRVARFHARFCERNKAPQMGQDRYCCGRTQRGSQHFVNISQKRCLPTTNRPKWAVFF